LTIENYVKTIYQLSTRGDNRPAATGEVADALGVLPGTVTSMLKTLAESGLARYTPYEGVKLTGQGTALALRVLRRHRLIELFLVKTLNLAWDEVHEEAENMEHAVSDWLVDRIDEYLGCPESDPHGDPIPRADGTMPRPDAQRLADLPVGQSFRLVRVLDQSPEFLRYLSDSGLLLGAAGHLVRHRPEAGIITVHVESGETTLGREAAEKLLVATDS
jgi:DtxR family Mn-dependent transcriptional regulator